MEQITTDYADQAFKYEGLLVCKEIDGWSYITPLGEPIKACPDYLSQKLQQAYEAIVNALDVMDIDTKADTRKEALEWIAVQGYDKGTHPTLKVGDQVLFKAGYHDDIKMTAKIKGINGNDIYVYSDCYWFPISANRLEKLT